MVGSGRAICRGGLAVRVPFSGLDEFGQVDAGGLAAAHCGCPVRALAARLEMRRDRAKWVEGRYEQNRQMRKRRRRHNRTCE